MTNVWLKAKVWTKLAVFAIVLIYAVAFIANNYSQRVSFWYWYKSEWDTTLLNFAFFAFIGGVLVMILVRTIYKTIGQFREMRRRNEQERRDRELRELQTKAAMLQTRPDASAPPPDAPPPDNRPAP